MMELLDWLAAEDIRDGHWTVWVEAGLAADGIGDGDWSVFWVVPFAAVLTVAEDVVQQLVNQWACIE